MAFRFLDTFGQSPKENSAQGISSADWSLSGIFNGNNARNVATQKQQVFNAKQAVNNRNFQERMSNTAVQRRMKDLDKAGINPILAGFGSGGGASTPGGSSASSSAAPQQGLNANIKAMATMLNSVTNMLKILK